MITQAQADLVRATARAAFFGALKTPPKGMVHQTLTTSYPSTADQETYPWLGQVPQLQKWEGLRGIKGLPAQKYTLPNIKWEATIAIEGELARRGKLGQVTTRARDLSVRAQMHRERLFIQRLLENGLCYDGQNYFDTDHKDVGAIFTTNQDNTSTSVAATGTLPTAAEMETAVDAILTKMRNFKDDQGEPWNMGEDLVFLIPPAYARPAMLALGASGSLNTNVADATGVTGVFRGIGEILVSNFIPALQTILGQTVDNKMFVFNRAAEVKPLILQVEVEPDFQELGPGSDHTFKTDTLLYGVWGSWNVGYGPWQQSVQHIFS